ncbi:hypothetical protein MMC17_009125 [Xylographa soralifera]|nr:hypothetical protein [Xylographa soralifera]
MVRNIAENRSGVAEADVDEDDDDVIDPEVELVIEVDPYEDAKLLVLDKEGDIENTELEFDKVADPDAGVTGLPPFDEKEAAVVEDGEVLEIDEP